MKKKIAVICALVMVIMSVAQSASAINVIMNSSLVAFPDQEPVIENWVTLVPLRPVAEALGLEITWDDPTDTVVLKKDNFFVELVIGSTTAKTSSGVKQMPVAPKIINGRTMVPIRFIAEELGLQVSWNPEYNRIIINGQIDTQSVPVVEPVENPTLITGEEATGPVESASDVTAATEPVEEETEFVEEFIPITVDAQSSSIMFEVPLTYSAEDADLENVETFFYRSLDAFDAQHTYNWEIVSTYESYIDESGTSGILYIVQQLEPYEGEEHDVSRIFDEYPEAPERPEIDFGYIMEEMSRLIIEQIYIEQEVEIPEGAVELEEEQHAENLGFASVEEYQEYLNGVVESFDMMQIPEYAEYADWQIANSDYRMEVDAINNAKSYAVRHFSDVKGQYEDEAWAEFFTAYLNSDEEVRYDDVEIIDFDGKKVIHATIVAQDPDDEQGVYDYYHYIDGDSVVTIFGGTLFGSEASPDVVDVLSRLTVQ